MDRNTALTEQLRNLTRDTGTGLDLLGLSIDALTTRLSEAIPSFLGMTVTMTTASGDLTLTAVGPVAQRTPRTSLRFSILRPAGGHARVVFYAHQPGALVDLDADLISLGRQPNGGASSPTAADVHLDQDLVAHALVPGVAGLEDQAVLSRAEGALIDRGAEPDQAASQLQQQAVAAGLDLHTYARQLLAARAAGTPQAE